MAAWACTMDLEGAEIVKLGGSSLVIANHGEIRKLHKPTQTLLNNVTLKNQATTSSLVVAGWFEIKGKQDNGAGGNRVAAQ